MQDDDQNDDDRDDDDHHFGLSIELCLKIAARCRCCCSLGDQEVRGSCCLKLFFALPLFFVAT